MAQPTFVPVPDADRVRPSIPAPIPLTPRRGRPGELRNPVLPSGPNVGTTGPDQGYALTLAHRAVPRLVLAPGEDVHDVVLGIALLASRRAALHGRAPSVHDVDVAAGLFGFLGAAPSDLLAHRGTLFGGVAHSYAAQRALIDAVSEQALRLAPESAADPEHWRTRLERT